MTKLLDRAFEAARALPADLQDDVARVMLQLVGEPTTPVALSDDERAAITRSKSAASRGEFASDEEVERVWKKHGL